MKLFSTIILFFYFNGFAQPTDVIIKKDIPPYWFGIGPQYCFGKSMSLAGGNLGFNFSVTNRIYFKVNAYVIGDVSYDENTMGRIANFSFLPGYRVYDKKYSFVQLHGALVMA